MTFRARLLVLLISVPVILLVVVGGVLSRTMPAADSYQHLRVFDDVVTLVMNNYVEQVETDKIMNGAMRGLAEGLDPDCAWLPAEDAAKLGKGSTPKGTIGVELTRQYYLRLIAARDNSPAARAGLRTGDFIRAIDDKPTREMSVFEGMGLLRGTPGTKVKLTVIRGNAAEPHVVEITREEATGAMVSGKIVKPGIGLVRVAGFSDRTASDLRIWAWHRRDCSSPRACSPAARRATKASATSRRQPGTARLRFPSCCSWTTARRRPLKSLPHRSPVTSAPR
jgi:carboxyl-terminal processing protease